MVEIEPYLPEPAREPATLFAGPPYRLLMQGWLFTRGVEIDHCKKTIRWAQYMIDAIQDGIKAGNLGECSVQW
jgi:hypothetical protein